MRTVILTVALSVVSFFATSQTFENPRVVKSIADANDMEWVTKSNDSNTMTMYGDKSDVRQYLFDLRQHFGLDDKPLVNGVASWCFFDRNGRALQMVASESGIGLMIIVKKGK
jgi:hypothetical protein